MVPMHVIDLCSCPASDSPMVLLEDDSGARWLAFYLPMNEANRLARVLGRAHGCVPIFDLAERLAQTMGAAVSRAEIHGDERGVRATLVYERDGADVAFDCHPADAMAIALRSKAPILAADSALAHACPVNGELRPRAVRRWLSDVSPSDFLTAPGRDDATSEPSGA